MPDNPRNRAQILIGYTLSLIDLTVFNAAMLMLCLSRRSLKDFAIYIVVLGVYQSLRMLIATIFQVEQGQSPKEMLLGRIERKVLGVLQKHDKEAGVSGVLCYAVTALVAPLLVVAVLSRAIGVFAFTLTLAPLFMLHEKLTANTKKSKQ